MEKHYQLWKKAWEAQHKNNKSSEIEVEGWDLPTIRKNMAKDKDEVNDSDNDDDDDERR